MSRRTRAAFRATIGVTALLAVVAPSGTATGAASGIDFEQTIGTVKAVDPDTRQISVITGCGHALRVMVFQASTACRIEVAGVGAPLASLRRGQIVAVRYRSPAPPYTAESIATPPAPVVERPR
jgi:hypothetical protein